MKKSLLNEVNKMRSMMGLNENTDLKSKEISFEEVLKLMDYNEYIQVGRHFSRRPKPNCDS